MAEVIGLMASVASLIAFTSETSKACHKLAERIASFKNATTDMQQIGVELMDIVQVMKLIESVLQPLQDGEVGLRVRVDMVERSLARIKTGVEDIADILAAAQPTARDSNTKFRTRWMQEKDDVTSMMTIINKQKQELLLQFNLLNTNFAHTTYTDLKDFRGYLTQVVPRTEDLAASITTSIFESTSRLEKVVQASATSLQSSIQDEIHQMVLSIPRESNISQVSLQTLSALVSNIVASRVDSEPSSNYPGSRSLTQIESAQRPPNESQTEDAGTMTRVSQAMIDHSCNEGSDHFDREKGTSKLISRTSIPTMTNVFAMVGLGVNGFRYRKFAILGSVISRRDLVLAFSLWIGWMVVMVSCNKHFAFLGVTVSTQCLKHPSYVVRGSYLIAAGLVVQDDRISFLLLLVALCIDLKYGHSVWVSYICLAYWYSNSKRKV
ncbi:hypothetical protein BDR22DRAFT_964768, partial [Usnea florida]